MPTVPYYHLQPPYSEPRPVDVRHKLPYDSRLIDHRSSDILEQRENTFNSRVWRKTNEYGFHSPMVKALLDKEGSRAADSTEFNPTGLRATERVYAITEKDKGRMIKKGYEGGEIKFTNSTKTVTNLASNCTESTIASLSQNQNVDGGYSSGDNSNNSTGNSNGSHSALNYKSSSDPSNPSCITLDHHDRYLGSQAVDFLRNWTRPYGQTFGFQHKRDANEVPKRSEMDWSEYYNKNYGNIESSLKGSAGRSGNAKSNSTDIRLSNYDSNDRRSTSPSRILKEGETGPGRPRAHSAQSYPARFPPVKSWKLNAYGSNQLPVRIRGGISTWLPSHSEIMFSHSKMCPGTETYRVKNPKKGPF